MGDMVHRVAGRKSGIIIGILFLVVLSAAMVLVWRFLFLEKSIVASATKFQCISYDPRYIFEGDITKKNFAVTEEQIRSDLRLISQISPCVRIYHATHGMELVPQIAKEFNMTVIGGAWIEGKDENEDKREVDTLIQTIAKNRNITMAFVGNEVLQFNRISKQKLIDYIERVRQQVAIPVGASERLAEWRNNQDLLGAVDVVGLHALPYWASVPIEDSVKWTVEEYKEAQKIAGGKMVFVTETGWPSLGAQRGESIPSLVGQAYFIRAFSSQAKSEGIQYNVFEAFDQPWKMYDEGRVGAHWGLFDSGKKIKFSLTGSVTNDRNWEYWAMGTTAVIILLGAIFLYLFRDLSAAGLLFGISIIAASSLIASIISQTAISEYMVRRPFLWLFVLPTQFFLLFLTLIQTVEVVEVIGKRRLTNVIPLPPRENTPKVSIHVPARDEDPRIVIRAIRSLLSLDYPNKEIIVIDNNTSDERLWKPVFEFSERYPGIVRFFHLDSCPGFKAGALNFGLSQTAPDAEIIGVVDADYEVFPSWLTETAGYFSDPHIAVVQAPQVHRTQDSNLFKRFIHHEYAGFFEIGMVQRNERNAIIQHGTMTLIRRNILEKMGGWSEQSITEDAELGVRILAEGYSMYYVHKTLGVGDPAHTFSAYRRQRFRWVYGAVRIVLRHFKKLFGINSAFTPTQTFYFVGEWAVWFAQALYPLFIFLGMLGSALVIFDQRFFPPSQFLYPSIFYFLFLLLSIFLVYRERVTKNIFQIIAAMVSGAALTPTISLAIWEGFLFPKKPFLRTRIAQEGNGTALTTFISLLKRMWIHVFLALWFSASVIVLLYSYGFLHRDAVMWVIILLILSFPSFCVITVSLLDFFSARKEKDGNVLTRHDIPAFDSFPSSINNVKNENLSHRDQL